MKLITEADLEAASYEALIHEGARWWYNGDDKFRLDLVGQNCPYCGCNTNGHLFFGGWPDRYLYAEYQCGVKAAYGINLISILEPTCECIIGKIDRERVDTI